MSDRAAENRRVTSSEAHTISARAIASTEVEDGDIASFTSDLGQVALSKRIAYLECELREEAKKREKKEKKLEEEERKRQKKEKNLEEEVKK